MIRNNQQPEVASTGLKSMLESGSIKINDITHLLPITWLADEMELNYNTLTKRLLDPKRFTAIDIWKLSTILKMDACVLLLRILIEVGTKEEDLAKNTNLSSLLIKKLPLTAIV